MVRRETLTNGDRRLRAGDASFVIRRVRPGVLSMVAHGADRSQFGETVVGELAAELDRFPIGAELFIDARGVSEVDLAARELWTRWLAQHRERLRKTHMLVSSAAMRLIGEVARHYSGAMLVIHDDPAAFDRALRRSAGNWAAAEATSAPSSATIRRKLTADGIELTDGVCRYTFHVHAPDVLLVRISGNERGALSSAVFDEIRSHFRAGRRLRLFIDLRDTVMPTTVVSELWAAWFTANRNNLGAVRILSTKRAVSITAAIVSWRSQTGALIDLLSDPPTFERALERTVHESSR